MKLTRNARNLQPCEFTSAEFFLFYLDFRKNLASVRREIFMHYSRPKNKIKRAFSQLNSNDLPRLFR